MARSGQIGCIIDGVQAAFILMGCSAQSKQVPERLLSEELLPLLEGQKKSVQESPRS
jgi:hypothetical protein